MTRLPFAFTTGSVSTDRPHTDPAMAPVADGRERLVIYLTRAERAQIERAATGEHAISLSDWSRRVLLRAADNERIG